jgi:predicted nuclease of predicted toxin-antitoxin system
MASFYADENFPLPVVEFLRTMGHDVVTARESGKAERSTPDAEILHYARTNQRALLTLNRRHFVRLHAQQPGHCGIIVCTLDRDFERQAR